MVDEMERPATTRMAVPRTRQLGDAPGEFAVLGAAPSSVLEEEFISDLALFVVWVVSGCDAREKNAGAKVRADTSHSPELQPAGC